MSGWLSATEAATRLGVKPATLYAYVSRGVLLRRRSPDGKSLFDPEDVERLARRGRPRRTVGASEVVIESRITALGTDRPYYRGHDALRLATSWQLEDVATLLWTGEAAPTDADPRPRKRAHTRPAARQWQATPEGVAAGRAAQAGLPANVLPLERLQVITPALAAADPLRLTLDPPAVTALGQSLIASAVECLPDAGPARGNTRAPSTIAGRLWAKLSPAPARPTAVDALRAALVLLADHELAASTLAVRVAASVRADPYAAVTAGLGVMGGALHGGATLAAEAMLAEATSPEQVRHVIGQRLRQGERIAGFGHSIYREADARAAALMDHIRTAAPSHPKLAVAQAMLDEARRRRLPPTNIDLSLAILTSVTGMVHGAGEAIFAIARMTGWLAHAMEEYANPTKLRLRATYTGWDLPRSARNATGAPPRDRRTASPVDAVRSE
jgi:citrate synthase